MNPDGTIGSTAPTFPTNQFGVGVTGLVIPPGFVVLDVSAMDTQKTIQLATWAVNWGGWQQVGPEQLTSSPDVATFLLDPEPFIVVTALGTDLQVYANVADVTNGGTFWSGWRRAPSLSTAYGPCVVARSFSQVDLFVPASDTGNPPYTVRHISTDANLTFPPMWDSWGGDAFRARLCDRWLDCTYCLCH
jgi:hypothetical protein